MYSTDLPRISSMSSLQPKYMQLDIFNSKAASGNKFVDMIGIDCLWKVYLKFK